VRGRIIHYNSNDGKGLISAENKQYPFEIAQWQSEIAPTLNATVDFDSDGERPSAVRRVPDDVLMGERARELGGKLSAFGGAALHSAHNATSQVNVGSLIGPIRKSDLVVQATFAAGAMFFNFLVIKGTPLAYSLIDLSSISEHSGVPIGSAPLTWLAILSMLIPMFWKNRIAWLALLLPMMAVLKPIWDIGKAIRSMGGLSSAADMIDPGFGMFICALSALALAVIGVKRFLLQPSTEQINHTKGE
jgi:hypothetical protein